MEHLSERHDDEDLRGDIRELRLAIGLETHESTDRAGFTPSETRDRARQADSTHGCGGWIKSLEADVLAIVCPNREERWRSYRLSNVAITLTTNARITAPKRYDKRAWRSTVRRMTRLPMSVSDTWNVIPTVNAMYAKSR